MFIGNSAREIIQENYECSIIVEFFDCLKTAYISCATYLQQKLPLANMTLQALAALDPQVRGYHTTSKHLQKLVDILQMQIAPSLLQGTHMEIVQYGCDNSLNTTSCEFNNDALAFWSSTVIKQNYPGLHAIACVAFSMVPWWSPHFPL